MEGNSIKNALKQDLGRSKTGSKRVEQFKVAQLSIVSLELDYKCPRSASDKGRPSPTIK